MDNSLELILRIKTENQNALKQLEADTKSLGNTTEEVAKKAAIATRKAIDDSLEQISQVKNLQSAKGKQLLEQLEMLDKTTAAEIRNGDAARKAAEEAAVAAEKRDKAYRQLASTMDAAAREDAARNKAAGAGMRDAEVAVAQLGRGMGVLSYQATALAQGSAGLTGAFGTMGVAVAAVSAGLVIGVREAFNLVKTYGEAERETANLALRLGLTVTQAEKLTAEAKMTGVSISSLEQSARLLGEALANPDEQGKKAAKSLHEMGISTHDLQGNMKDLGPVVLQVLEKLSTMPEAAERARYAQETLGRGAKELMPLIANYTELQRVVASIHIGEDATGSQELLKANRAINELEASWNQFKKSLATRIAPVVVPVTFSIADALNGKHSGADFLGALFARAVVSGAATPGSGSSAEAHGFVGPQIAPDTADAAAFRKRDGGTKEGLEDQLKSAKKKRDDLRGLLSGGDLDKTTFDKDKGEYDKAEADMTRIQKALDSIKEAKKEVKQQDQETIALEEELGRLRAKELTGLDEILAKHQAKLMSLDKEHKLNTVNRTLEDAINATLIQQYSSPAEIEKAGNKADSEIHPTIARDASKNESDLKMFFSDDIPQLRAALDKFKKDLEHGLATTAIRDSADGDKVRRGLDVALSGNKRSVGDTMTAAGASNADLTARIAAAHEIFDIETRHLDLIADQGKREEEMAKARKKESDEIYAAEAKHEEDLQAQRQKDLDEYKSFFVGFLNAALQQHISGLSIQNYLKGFGHQILDKAAGNVAGLTFDTVQKNLPTIPGQTNAQGGLTTLGKVLNGVPGLGHQNAAQQPAVAATTHLTTSTDLLRTSVDNLNSTLQGRAGGPGSGAPGTGTSSPSFGIPGVNSSGGFGSFGSFGNVFGTEDGSQAQVSGDIGDGLPMDSTGMDHGVQPVSTGTPGIGTMAAGGLAAAGGTMQAISGFSKGGAKGITQGIGGALTAGAGIAAMIPGGQLVALGLGIAAGVTDLIGSFMGSSKDLREKAINTEISKDQYLAPTALNTTQGPGGTYEDFDAHGNIRTSSLSALPTVTEPYITSRHLNGATTASYYDAPGQATSPYSGSPTGNGAAPVSNGTTINLHVNAIDTQSGMDFLMNNHMAVGASLAQHLQTHEGPASNAIRYVAGNS